MSVDDPESETVKITLGAEGASLVVSELHNDYDVFYILQSAGPGGSIYDAIFINPEGGNEIHYEVIFTSLIDQETSDYIIGSLRSEVEDCVITRNFDGNRVD